MPFSSFRRRAVPRAVPVLLAAALTGCVAPQHGAQVAAFHDAVAVTADSDRTKAARIAAGLTAAAGGVGLACTMLNDSAPVSMLASLRAFCDARATTSEKP
ncbi:MAG: hypothetical protein AAFQ88_00220 [Pseudomonadota bacterium]